VIVKLGRSVSLFVVGVVSFDEEKILFFLVQEKN